MDARPGTPAPGQGKSRSSRTSRSVTASPAVAAQARRPPQRRGGPRERRREPAFVRVLSVLLTMTTAALLAVAAIVARYDAAGPLAKAKMVSVARGTGIDRIAAQLEADGVIADRWTFGTVFLLYRMIGTRKTGEPKAGTYEFKPGASMSDVAEILMEGKSALVRVSIPEGLTSTQIVERLKAMESLVGEVTAVPAEGTLLPDTLIVQPGTQRQDILDRLRADQQRFLQAAWEKRAPNLPVATPDEALILASIVEKETGKGDERERVAAVFVNRLRKKMRLQSDPTIIYGITLGAGPLGRPIYRSDIEQKTAYNTYQIDGLPPTPIANPGRKSIEAVLNPAQTNELYFVADGTGGHTFSETLKEHNAAVAQWRRIERETKAQREAAGARDVAAAATAAGAGGGVRVNGLPVPASTGGPAPEPATTAATSGEGDIPLPVRKPKR